MTILPPTAPVVPAIRPFPWDNTPYTNVTPLTIRDNATMQWETERIKEWVRDQLVPHVDGTFADLLTEWVNSTDALFTGVNGALTEQAEAVNTALSTQEANVNALVGGITEYVDEAETNFDAHVATKQTEFNTYADGKESEFDTYVEGKETQLDTYTAGKQSAFNTYVDGKELEFDGYVEGKKPGFDDFAADLVENPSSDTYARIATRVDDEITDRTGTVGGIAAQSAVDSLIVDVAAITADPTDAVTTVELLPQAFTAIVGAPTLTTLSSRLAIWSLLNGADRYISTVLRVPSHWATVDVYVWWTNTAANAGNVSWAAQFHQWADGESLNVTPTGAGAIVAADVTPNTAKRSKVATALAVDPTKHQTLRVMRNGASGADTLPNACGVVMVELVKVS